MFKTYLEIISQEKYKKFEKKNKKYLTSEKYKQRSEELLKRFFTNKDNKVVNTIIIPYVSTNEYLPTSVDKEIITYLNNNGYKCTEESYLLGYCINDKNKEMPIVDVLKMISQYNLEKLEKQKQENLQYSAHYDNRIKAKQNFKENYLTYYQNFNKDQSKVIAFTWLPRVIASMSTDVGWTSCMNLYDKTNNRYVFPTIEAGAFIAWLVQKGDEEILDNPQARVLIKVYVSDNNKIFWYPSERIYGTAPQDFYKKVRDFVLKKQEIHITDEDLQNIYKFDTSQYSDSPDPNQITLKVIFKEKYTQILENKIKNNTKFTITNLKEALQFNIDINLIKKILETIKNTLTKEEYEKILKLAYENNNYNIINTILSNPTYYNLININTLFLYAVKINNINIVKNLLQKGVDPSVDNNSAIQIAAEKGYIEIVKLLLKDKRVNPSSNYNFAIINAINNKHTEIVKLLLQDKRTKLSSADSYVIHTAAENGYAEIVKLLLQDKRVNPNDLDNFAIRYAAENGHTEVVKLLLKDKRVNPSDVDNFAIRIAAANGHIEVVKLLLQDEKVDPSDDNNYAIRYAAKNGHTEVVKLLSQDKRVNPSDDDNYAIRIAAEKGYTEIVKFLLQYKKIDPSDVNNYAIRYAAANGHIEVVKLLLQDLRVDPSDLNNYAIRYAAENGHIEIVKLLLQDKRVRSTFDIDDLITTAKENNQSNIIKLLQQYK